MGTTPNRQYPLPEYADAADVPSAMKSLGDGVDKDVADLYAKIADLTAKIPSNKVKYGNSTLEVKGSAGEAILTHAAGYVPTHVLLTPRSGTRAIALTVDTDGATTQNVRVRAYNVDTGAPLADGSTFGCYWTVRG
jgi:hypothetical protein